MTFDEIHDSDEAEYTKSLKSEQALSAIKTWEVLRNRVHCNSPKQVMFLHFHFQVVQEGYLTISSLMRRHAMQAVGRWRVSLEAACKSLYCINNPDEAHALLVLNSQNNRKFDTDLRDAAYKWLEDNKHEFSNRVQETKDKILHHGAHAGLVSVSHNVGISEEAVWLSAQDDVPDEVRNTLFLLYEDIALEYLSHLIEPPASSELTDIETLRTDITTQKTELERHKAERRPHFVEMLKQRRMSEPTNNGESEI